MSTARSEDLALFRLRYPIPAVPFTTRWAEEHGIHRRVLARLVGEGVVRRPLRGVYVDALIPDSTELRIQAVSRVAPPGSVACDWTACWIWTGMESPGSHLVVPRPAVFKFRGQGRSRHGEVRSGERWLRPSDVVPLVDGLWVTTPIRTAWDMGRFASRYVAIGAMDALMRADRFGTDELLDGLARFKKQRGVVQLRELAAIVDPRSESMGESAVRLHWLEIPYAPVPVPQVVLFVRGREVRLDLGAEEIRYAAEYDGEAHHSTEEQKAHDERRRESVRLMHDWHIDVLRKVNVFGQHADVGTVLRRGMNQASARR